jgi:hypothetical protein
MGRGQTGDEWRRGQGSGQGEGSYCADDRAEEQACRRGVEEEEEREKVLRTGLENLEGSGVSQ